MITELQDILNKDIINVDVKYRCFLSFIDNNYEEENRQRAEHLISMSATKYNTIQNVYNLITNLIKEYNNGK